MPDVETPRHATEGQSTKKRPHYPGRREQSAPVHVYVAAYDSSADAHADHKLLRELKHDGRVEADDAALVFRDDHGRLHVHKRERVTRRSTWTGVGVGALIGLVFPPDVVVNAATSGAMQHLTSSLRHGMSRRDLKQLGDALEASQAALVILSASALQPTLDAALTHSDRRLQQQIAGAAELLERHLTGPQPATHSFINPPNPSGDITMATTTTEQTPANRAGRRVGEISELSVIAPLNEGGAERLRSVLADPASIDAGVKRVGTVHNLRWVFFDGDTRVLFATTYEGDWDAYIDDFATKIPTLMDALFGDVVGWPGITSPTVKDFIAEHQITAEVWFSAYPDLRLSDINRQRRVTTAVDDLLDAVNP